MEKFKIFIRNDTHSLYLTFLSLSNCNYSDNSVL